MMDFKSILYPHLIQRGSFRAIEEKDIVGMESLVQFDYMGSSEFEFGALSASLKRIVGSWGEYEWFKAGNIKDADGQPLWVLCRLRQHEEILKAVEIFATNPHQIHTQEWVGLDDYLICKSEHLMRTNFWWDVTSNDAYKGSYGNDWMACFGGNIRYIVIAINKLCEKWECKIPVEEWPAIPPFVEKIKPEIYIENMKGMIRVCHVDGSKNTVIATRRILKIDAISSRDNQILLTMRSDSGSETTRSVTIKPSSARSLFLNLVRDWPDINKRSKI
jgi:hypothetical protein